MLCREESDVKWCVMQAYFPVHFFFLWKYRSFISYVSKIIFANLYLVKSGMDCQCYVRVIVQLLWIVEEIRALHLYLVILKYYLTQGPTEGPIGDNKNWSSDFCVVFLYL